jgi:hypothetical protein
MIEGPAQAGPFLWRADLTLAGPQALKASLHGGNANDKSNA